MTRIHATSFYKFSCFSVAFSLTLYWIYEYSLDKDLCTVDFKKYYDDKQDEFPTLSICLDNENPESTLRTLHPPINKSMYLKFLKGAFFDADMIDIDYRNVTADLNDYIVAEYVSYRNGSYFTNSYLNSSRKMFSLTYTGIFFEAFYNCYTLSIPKDRHIRSYGAIMKNGIFPHNQHSRTYAMLALLHYPNQLLLSAKTLKYSWPDREEYENFGYSFGVNGIEVLRRRNKRTKPCREDWDKYDDVVLLDHIRKIGCRSPYQYPSILVPLCNSSDTILKAVHGLRHDDYGLHPPCKAMEKIYYTYDEPQYKGTKWDTGKDRYWIYIKMYENQFKEILKTRYKVY